MDDRELKAMNKTTYDRGMEQGLEQGRILGARNALLRLGRRMFQEPPPAIVGRIQAMSNADRIDALIDRVLEVESWEELLRDE
jgi:hypothetical protein